MINTAILQKCFNQAACHYDELAHIQHQVGEVLIGHILNRQQAFLTIVDVGCGTGLTTEKLTTMLKYKTCYGIDLSENMLQIARQRLASHIHLQQANFNHLHFQPQTIDLLFSNLVLHWGADLVSTLKHLSICLSRKGLLAFSIPLQGTFSTLLPLAQQKFYSMQAVKDELLQLPHQKLIIHTQCFTATYPDIYTAISAVKMLGVNHVAKKAVRSLQGKNKLQKVLQRINTTPFLLDYQVGFFLLER